MNADNIIKTSVNTALFILFIFLFYYYNIRKYYHNGDNLGKTTVVLYIFLAKFLNLNINFLPISGHSMMPNIY